MAQRGNRAETVCSANPGSTISSGATPDGRQQGQSTGAPSLSLGAATRYPGHQGVTVVPPPAGDREYLIVFRFDTEEHLRAWEESDERRRLIERSSTLADEPPRERQLTGLETWFAVPGGQVRLPPPPWKMWLLSSVASGTRRACM